jgi:hypothetical protein
MVPVDAGSPDARPGGQPSVTATRTDLDPGTPIDVRDRFQGSWVRGFEVAEVDDDGNYRVRRLSDASILPGTFARDDVRRQRRGRSGWWY